MKKTIMITDVTIGKREIGFVILVMSGGILVSKSDRYFIKFSKDVSISNSSVIASFKSVLKSFANRKSIRNYNVVVDLAEDVDLAEVRKTYTGYLVADSGGISGEAVR